MSKRKKKAEKTKQASPPLIFCESRAFMYRDIEPVQVTKTIVPITFLFVPRPSRKKSKLQRTIMDHKINDEN